MTKENDLNNNSEKLAKAPDDQFVEQIVNSALDHSVELLPTEVQRGLNSARVTALQSKPNGFRLYHWATAASVVMALVIVSQLSTTNQDSVREIPNDPFAEVLSEDLDMINELEFVYWLAEEQQVAESTS
ncbi:MAG: hypothetical protein V2I33_00850 [Kangiellaceae bacterium]|jgi:hypothetical protein|nr:hypothetical protein [Kangiellaceae bacterium]